jgi:hypothetical protein
MWIRTRIRILLIIIVTQICDHWSTNPPGLHLEPLLFHGEPLKHVNFVVNADSDQDPAFQSNADPDLASQNNADPMPQPG